MVGTPCKTSGLRLITDLPASPSSLAFLAAGQVTGLPITPVHPQSIVIGTQPQRQGANRSSWRLAVCWRCCSFEVVELSLELVQPQLQTLNGCF